MSRGFVISAQNTEKVNYVKCAEALAYCIKKIMPNENVSLISNNNTTSKHFDKIIKLPYGDLDEDSDWKLINDYQIYDASPYDETIKLEADIYLPRDISHWFDILSINDVTVCNKIRNYKGEISNVRSYRRFIDENNLPDVYNAITFFKKSELAKVFFNIIKDVFENWNSYKSILKCNAKEQVTTDWAYAIACHTLGIEKTTIPNFEEFSMVHMKQLIAGVPTENWTDTLIYEINPENFRIQTFTQCYPVHYVYKKFANNILEIN